MKRFLLQFVAALVSVGCSAVSPPDGAVERGVTTVADTSCPRCGTVVPLTGGASDYDELLTSIGDARVVALGENTHGTQEFYRERARITERLVREKQFRALVIEADWPDTDRVNRYVRGVGEDKSAGEALRAYRDFPRWMWRNAEFRDLVERLRAYNQTLPEAERVGVYGMDIYNLFGAMDAVREFVREQHPSLVAQVQEHYRCFSPYSRNLEAYGAATRNPSTSCAVQARAVRDLLTSFTPPSGNVAGEEHFSAVRSAASVAGAEEYFRASFSGSNSWNVRDRWMVANIEDIARHVGGGTEAPGKVIVWAHNSHVGDARATDAPLRGELNVGQLLRESMGEAAYLVGLFTYRGTVIAASEWDAPGVRQPLRRALPESYSGIFHASGLENAFLLYRDGGAAEGAPDPLLQRAVGVIYRPETEKLSHYLRADIERQFDAVVFMDETRALKPF